MAKKIRLRPSARLAMNILDYLSKKPAGPLNAKSIATRFDKSTEETEKILVKLKKKGLVNLVGNEWALLANPESTNLLTVYEAVTGTLRLTGCLMGNVSCDGETCQIGEVLCSSNRKLLDALSETMLSDWEPFAAKIS